MVLRIDCLCFIGRFSAKNLSLREFTALNDGDTGQRVLQSAVHDPEGVHGRKNMVQCFTILIDPQSKAKVAQVDAFCKFYQN